MALGFMRLVGVLGSCIGYTREDLRRLVGFLHLKSFWGTLARPLQHGGIPTSHEQKDLGPSVPEVSWGLGFGVGLGCRVFRNYIELGAKKVLTKGSDRDFG